jgi:hypothetical protein
MIPPSREWPKHLNSQCANTTRLWHGSDSEQEFNNNLLDEYKRNQLAELGWLETEITYKFNQQGFRTDEFDTELSAGLAIGCSFTQGTGVLQEFTWPEILSRKLNFPIWNLGVAGCSMDTVFRLLEYWLPVLTPKFVFLACPPRYRLEVIDYDGGFSNFSPGRPDHLIYKQWIINDANIKLNFRKNLLAITALCNQYNVPLLSLTADQDFEHDHSARDLAHPGPESYEKFADKMIQKLEGIT